ncbi:hypothetical protein SLS60_008518 [Paraconiothyrium brasiliense]|uniref:Uncharacterized protein n=1 Tax=Paraconiothyrium brasiliense TaxID=300254 RepID=A0ABR3R0T9_9PLEO
MQTLNISLGEAEVDFKTPSTQEAPFRVNNPTCRRARNHGDLLRYWDPAWRTILCDMIGLKHLAVTLIGEKYDDEKYAEPVLKALLELRGLMTFKLVLQGHSKVGSEAARLESLQERSRTLQMILESATNEDDGGKRKAEDLDWGPPPPAPPRKKRRKSERNLYRY